MSLFSAPGSILIKNDYEVTSRGIVVLLRLCSAKTSTDNSHWQRERCSDIKVLGAYTLLSTTSNSPWGKEVCAWLVLFLENMLHYRGNYRSILVEEIGFQNFYESNPDLKLFNSLPFYQNNDSSDMYSSKDLACSY